MTDMSAPAYRVSRNVLGTITPPIPLARLWISQYQGSRPLIDMSEGVPGLSPPSFLQRSLANYAGSSESFGYTAVLGEARLRQGMASEMQFVYGHLRGDGTAENIKGIESSPNKDDDAGVDVTADDTGLTAGANMAFLACMTALAEKGDDVILPVPWYFNHQMALSLLGITSVPLPCYPEHGFVPSVDECRKLITERTKAIALVTPNNPTGAIYPSSLLFQFAKLARERNIALIIDETYRDLVPSPPAHDLFDPAKLGWDWRRNIIHIFSFSKSYCLPGHRLGLVAASPSFLSGPLTKVLDTMQICAPRPIQLALADHLTEMRPFIEGTRESLEKRHKLFREALERESAGRWKVGSQGGYYAFVRHPWKGRGSREVCERLAKEMGVVALPEEFFCEARALELNENGVTNVVGGENVEEVVPGGEDGDRWIRFSVANVPDEKVVEVCSRLGECLQVFEWELNQ